MTFCVIIFNILKFAIYFILFPELEEREKRAKLAKSEKEDELKRQSEVCVFYSCRALVLILESKAS